MTRDEWLADQKLVHAKAKAIVELGNLVVLDTETTGLDGHAEVIQIAVVDRSGAVLLDSLVKPTCPVPAEATAVHGISDSDLVNAPTMNQSEQQLRSTLRWPIRCRLQRGLRFPAAEPEPVRPGPARDLRPSRRPSLPRRRPGGQLHLHNGDVRDLVWGLARLFPELHLAVIGQRYASMPSGVRRQGTQRLGRTPRAPSQFSSSWQ